MQKVVIIGCSGSGKSTLAKKLGRKLGIKPVDLDTVRFTQGPKSEKRSVEDFIHDVAKLANNDKWIFEGIYYRHGIEDVLWRKADTVIWLDLPFHVIGYRVWKRSLARAIHRGTMPSGTKVTWKSEFGKGGITRVIHKIYKATQNYYPDLLNKINSETQVVRITSNSKYKHFMHSIEN